MRRAWLYELHMQKVLIMIMTPALRRFAFTTHVTSSVGWVGAVMVFLALAIIGLLSPDEVTVRGVYLVMLPTAWFVLIPLAHASLVSGIVLSVVTTWGLFRHYWVVFKLLITTFATIILLIYMGTFREMAGVAADPMVELTVVRNASPVVHAILALILLIIATILGIYKPFGLTGYGKRSQTAQRQALSATGFARATTAPASESSSAPRGMYVGAIAALGTLLLFVLLHHFLGGSLRH